MTPRQPPTLTRQPSASDAAAQVTAADELNALVRADAARIAGIEERLSHLLGDLSPTEAVPSVRTVDGDDPEPFPSAADDVQPSAPQDLYSLCESLQRVIRKQQQQLETTQRELASRVTDLERRPNSASWLAFFTSMLSVRFWRTRNGQRTAAAAVVGVGIMFMLLRTLRRLRR